MGNILRCLTGGDNHGDDHYRPHYHPTSEPGIILQSGWGSPPRFQPDHHQLGPHGGVASLVQDLLNFESTSMVNFYPLPSVPYSLVSACLSSFCHLFSYCKSLTVIFLVESP